MHTYKLDLYTGELYHFGIKGQKWGVRRYQNTDGSLTPEGYVHYGRRAGRADTSGKVSIGLGSIATGLTALSYGSRQYANAKNVKNATNTAKSIAKTLNKDRQTLNNINNIPTTFGKYPEYLKNRTAILNRKVISNTSKLNKANDAKNIAVAAAKAAASLTVGEKAALIASGALILGGLGYLGYSAYSKNKIRKSAAIEDKQNSMQHSLILDVSSNELYHHGILGMRWGIRRYQNKDGSLTPEGQLRYNKELYRLNKKKAKLEAKKTKLEAKVARKKSKYERNKKKKPIVNALLYKKLVKNDPNNKKEKAAEKVSKMLENNKKTKTKPTLISDKDMKRINSILSNGEKTTHNMLDRFYRDKYVLDGQKKLETKQFKNMSTQELNNYINRYETETRWLGAKEKRSIYDFNSRTLKRASTNFVSIVSIAIGVAAIKHILTKKYD